MQKVCAGICGVEMEKEPLKILYYSYNYDINTDTKHICDYAIECTEDGKPLYCLIGIKNRTLYILNGTIDDYICDIGRWMPYLQWQIADDLDDATKNILQKIFNNPDNIIDSRKHFTDEQINQHMGYEANYYFNKRIEEFIREESEKKK